MSYSTTIVAAWLRADQEVATKVRKLASAAIDTYESGVFFNPRSPSVTLAKELRELVEDRSPTQRNTLWGDLLDDALDSVDWYQLADRIVDEVWTVRA